MNFIGKIFTKDAIIPLSTNQNIAIITPMDLIITLTTV